MSPAKSKKSAGLKAAATVAGGAAFAAAEAKARPWAAWILALALLGCLTAWGTRESIHTKQLQIEKREQAELTAETKTLTKQVESLRTETREKTVALESLRKSSSSIRKGKKTRDAAGNETEEWEERLETMEEAISQIERERDEAQLKLSQAEQELSTAIEQRVHAEQLLAEATKKQVTHKGVQFAVGADLDLTRIGSNPDRSLYQRLRLSPAVHFGPWAVRAGFSPEGLTNEAALAAGGYQADWWRIAPSIGAEIKLP